MTLVSAIVPVYNVEAYLAKCLDSLLAQTHPHVEILVVNDGSTDGSAGLCDAYGRLNSRMQVIHKANGGLSDARNAGLRQARGDYVVFLDGDDWIDPQGVSELHSAAVREAADVVVAGYHVDVEDAAGHLVRSDGRVPQPHLVVPGRGAVPTINVELLNFVGYAWNKMYSRELLLKAGVTFPLGVSLVEDIVFNGPTLSRAKRILFLDAAFVHYVQRPRETLGNRSHADFPGLLAAASAATREMLRGWDVPEFRIDSVVHEVNVARLRWELRTAAKGGFSAGVKSLRTLLGDSTIRAILGKELRSRLGV